MGWFTREPKADPVGDICRLLAEKPWEWESLPTSKRADGSDMAAVEHVTKVRVYWMPGGVAHAWVVSGGAYMTLHPADALRIRAAVLKGMAARATQKPRPFFADAVALARAVLAGEHEAAYSLADEVFAHAKGKGDGS